LGTGKKEPPPAGPRKGGQKKGPFSNHGRKKPELSRGWGRNVALRGPKDPHLVLKGVQGNNLRPVPPSEREKEKNGTTLKVRNFP